MKKQKIKPPNVPKLNLVDSLNVMHLGFNKDEAEKKQTRDQRRKKTENICKFDAKWVPPLITHIKIYYDQYSIPKIANCEI